MSPNPYRPPASISDADNRLVDLRDETKARSHRLPPTLEFVKGAVAMAIAELATGSDVPAIEVCRMAVQTAYDLNGSDAPSMLDDFGLSRSEDIGTAIDELIAMGVLRSGEADSADDFAGLYDSSTSPSSWRVRWEADASEDGG